MFDSICHMLYFLFLKFGKYMFGIFGPLFNNTGYFWPRHMNIRTQIINFASTRISGSPFSDLSSHLSFSSFRTSNQNFEHSTGISSVRPESRTFGRDSEHWKPVFGPFIALSFFPTFPVAHVLQPGIWIFSPESAFSYPNGPMVPMGPGPYGPRPMTTSWPVTNGKKP